jgi:hypothetical protein
VSVRALVVLALLALPSAHALPFVYGPWSGVGTWSVDTGAGRCDGDGSVDLATWGAVGGLFVVQLEPDCAVTTLAARAEGDLETGFTFDDDAGLARGYFRLVPGGYYELSLRVCACGDLAVEGPVAVHARYYEAPTIIL